MSQRTWRRIPVSTDNAGAHTDPLDWVEEQRLRIFENTVFRKIFDAKRDEVTGEWRKLHNAELHALYSSPGTIRNIKSIRLRWAGHVAAKQERGGKEEEEEKEKQRKRKKTRKREKEKGRKRKDEEREEAEDEEVAERKMKMRKESKRRK
ncbi:hypothetical protein ANN_11575 [Periplaneta americana]|uniref:Uncharacterized protein n=1 Tax=Periplaneta americana TaxID=6978 RepID=A0ABQ8T5E7_PERAM|nr:hypothetical protein ANN_11575 [Periplaneta americana]